MGTLEIAGLVATTLTILGVIIGAAVRLALFPSERKITVLEAENTQLRHKLNEITESQAKLLESLTLLKTKSTEAQSLKTDIDEELRKLAQMAEVASSSILVPYPPSHDTRFAFLSISGPEASKLKNTLLDINKGVAGYAFATGQARISNNPQTDTRWNPKVDKQLAFRTENLLCLPLKYGDTTVGVVQFLNKPNGFSEQDKDKIDRATAILAYKVAQFVQDVDNFEILGLAHSQETDDGSVMCLDMSASSSLLRGAHPIPRTDVVNLINEYLDKLSKIAIAHGCIIDKFMWDGCLLSLNVVEPVPDHRKTAFHAALAMNQEFRKIKESWLRGDYPVQQLFLRIAIASGTVIQVDMGPAQYRQKTIVGDPVVAASALCETAPRNRDVIIVEQSVYDALPSHSMKSYKVPQSEMGKARGLITGAYWLEMPNNGQNE